MKKIIAFSLFLFLALSANNAYSLIDRKDAEYSVALKGAYTIADLDETGPNYYGFVDHKGNWYIMKETTSGSTKSYGYQKGDSDYSTEWTNRASGTYQTFDSVFY